MVDRGEMTPDLAARLSPEWASFPTLAGASYYGQPVKRFDDLKRFYEENLSQLRQAGEPAWQTVAIRQVPPAVAPIQPEVAEQLESVEQPEASTSNSFESPTGRLDPSGRF
jgi:lysozyme